MNPNTFKKSCPLFTPAAPEGKRVRPAGFSNLAFCSCQLQSLAQLRGILKLIFEEVQISNQIMELFQSLSVKSFTVDGIEKKSFTIYGLKRGCNI